MDEAELTGLPWIALDGEAGESLNFLEHESKILARSDVSANILRQVGRRRYHLYFRFN